MKRVYSLLYIPTYFKGQSIFWSNCLFSITKKKRKMKNTLSYPKKWEKKIFCDLEKFFDLTVLNPFAILLSFYTIESALFFKVHNFRKFFFCLFICSKDDFLSIALLSSLQQNSTWNLSSLNMLYRLCMSVSPPRMIRCCSNLRVLPLRSTYRHWYAGVHLHHLPEFIMYILSPLRKQWHHGGNLKSVIARIFIP